MHVCVYAYVHICIHTYMYMSMYVCMYVYEHVCMLHGSVPMVLGGTCCYAALAME